MHNVETGVEDFVPVFVGRDELVRGGRDRGRQFRVEVGGVAQVAGTIYLLMR